MAASALVEKGRNLAREGDLDGAVGEFKEALELDPNLELDPGKEARRLAASGLVEKGRKLARAGDLDGAVGEFKEALELDPIWSLIRERKHGGWLLQRWLKRAGTWPERVISIVR